MTTSSFDNEEDEKLLVLARATLRRTHAKQAGAIRDTTGRTYVGINVDSHALHRDAAETTFIIALASQISGIESAVFVGDSSFDISPLREFSPTCFISFVDDNGEIARL